MTRSPARPISWIRFRALKKLRQNKKEIFREEKKSCLMVVRLVIVRLVVVVHIFIYL